MELLKALDIVCMPFIFLVKVFVVICTVLAYLFWIGAIGCMENIFPTPPPIAKVNVEEAITVTVQKWEEVTGLKVKASTITTLKTYAVVEEPNIPDDYNMITSKSWTSITEPTISVDTRSYKTSKDYTYNEKMRFLTHELIHVIAFLELGTKDENHTGPELWENQDSIEYAVNQNY